MSADWDEELNLLDLVGEGRSGTGVKKGWLVGGVERKVEGEERKGADELMVGEETEGVRDDGDGGDRVRTFCIEWGGMWM